MNFLKPSSIVSFFKKNSYRYIYYLNAKHWLSRFTSAFISDERFIKNQYRLITGFELDLENPTTFNEKLQWLKINYKNKNQHICADKYKVRDYVEDKVGSHILNTLLASYDSTDEIDLDQLPSSFVIKVNHGSGQNLFVSNKKDEEWRSSKKLLDHYMKTNHFYEGREWAYKNIEPKIICEKLLIDQDGSTPDDYKVFCFNGKARLIQVDLDRFGNHQRNMYDVDWNLQPVQYKYDNSCTAVEKPEALHTMIEYAERLSAEFPFVRVDFYYIDKQIYFGEMTFYPENAVGIFTPKSYDEFLGNYLKLPTSFR